MKMFIWHDIGGVADNYHDGGSLLVVADNLEHALTLIEGESEEEDNYEFDSVSSNCDAFTKPPTFVYDVVATEPKVLVFENAGCC